MKRRDFLRSAGATAVLPVLPPILKVAAPAAAAPFNAMQVGWAALYARVHNQATPALIQKWLRVGPDQANALMSELINRNIIKLPIAGSATAVQPMYPGGGYAGMFDKSRKLVEKTKNVFDALVDDEPSEDAVIEHLERLTQESVHETS